MNFKHALQTTLDFALQTNGLSRLADLMQEASELTAIIVASRKTARHQSEIANHQT